jgi:hypothetical protein
MINLDEIRKHQQEFKQQQDEYDDDPEITIVYKSSELGWNLYHDIDRLIKEIEDLQETIYQERRKRKNASFQDD